MSIYPPQGSAKPTIKITGTRTSRIYASDGITIKDISAYSGGVSQDTPANGDKNQMFFYADGTEKTLYLTTTSDTNGGIFDVYINNILDSSGYDSYAAVSTVVNRKITLTQPIVYGYNIIELRMNGKNASSNSYQVIVQWMSIS